MKPQVSPTRGPHSSPSRGMTVVVRIFGRSTLRLVEETTPVVQFVRTAVTPGLAVLEISRMCVLLAQSPLEKCLSKISVTLTLFSLKEVLTLVGERRWWTMAKHLSVLTWLTTWWAIMLPDGLSIVICMPPILAATVKLKRTTRMTGTFSRTSTACWLWKTRKNLPWTKDTNRPTAHTHTQVWTTWTLWTPSWWPV